MFKVIPIYAALLAFFYVYLSFRTIGMRRKAKISIGDGGDDRGGDEHIFLMATNTLIHAHARTHAPVEIVEAGLFSQAFLLEGVTLLLQPSLLHLQPHSHLPTAQS
jgi:uncharacterized membrane protein YecN with MAPEG domain